MNKIVKQLYALPVYLYIPLMLALMLLVSITLSALGLEPEDNPLVEKQSIGKLLLMGCLLVPFLETFILQFIPVHIVLFLNKSWKIPAVLVSAILFSATHPFGWGYLIHTLITGLILAFSYVLFLDRKNKRQAFLVVFVLHGCWNLIVTIVDLLFT